MSDTSEKKTPTPEGTLAPPSPRAQLRFCLWMLLLLEGFILALLHPTFFGVPAVANVLTVVSQFLKDILWPATAADMDTYKGVVYHVWTSIQSWPIYPVLEPISPWVVPVALVLTYLPQRKKPLLADVAEIAADICRVEPKSGMYPKAVKEANQYHDQMTAKCDNPFVHDPGVWVQILSGPDTKRTYVAHWDEQNELTISGIIEGEICLKLRNGQAYWDTHEGERKVTRGVPIVVKRDNRGNQQVNQCIITWL